MQPACSAKGATVRLNKALASAGVCSRRAADDLIRSGRVTVNGKHPEGMGQAVDPAVDEIRLDGKLVTAPDTADQAYFILHKPPGVVTTASDPEGRQTVLDLMRESAPGLRLFPVGRLDYFSEGLLILTTDGELANRLMHPRWHMPKTYKLVVRGQVTEEILNAMRAGMTLSEGDKLAPVKVRIGERLEDRVALEMELVQGINRQIRRMCRDLGLTVLRLVRINQGPLALGSLAAGKCRPLTSAEVGTLKAAVGLT